MNLPPQLRRPLAIGWRNRWIALGVAWLVCLAGWAGTALIPNSFETTSRIYADADAILSQLLRDIAVDGSPAQQVEVLQRTLLSRPNLERVVARTGLDMRITDLASREAMVLGLQKDIRITPQTRNLFTITYRDRDPRIARDVVKATVDLFLEAATSNDRQQMEGARAFLAQQITNYERQLRDAEQRRAEFRSRYIELLPSESLGGATRLESARTTLAALQGQLQDALDRRALLARQVAETPASLASTEGGGGGAPGVPSGLAEAERTLAALRLRYTDQHPDVQAARAMVAEMRANGGGLRTGGGSTARTVQRANPLHEQLKVRLIDTESLVTSLQRQVRDAEAEIARLDTIARSQPEILAQSLNLDRDYTVLQGQYKELLERRESLQLAGAARTGSDRVRLEVVDPPVLAQVPVAPNRFLLASGVLVVGLGAGGALAFLLAQLNSAFFTTAELRQVGLPVLGGVSSVSERPRHTGAIFGFGFGLLVLFAMYGAVLAGGPGMVARVLRQAGVPVP